MKTKMALTKCKVIAWIQIFWGMIFAICTFSVFSLVGSDGMGIGMFLFYFICTILFFYSAYKRLNLLKAYSQYTLLLSSDPYGSLTKLAEQTHTREDIVINNFRKMIQKKFFLEAQIDMAAHRVYLPGIMPTAPQAAAQSPVQEPAKMQPAAQTAANTENSEPEFYSVTCKSCGAVNHVQKGKKNFCEYCGSALE